MAVEQSITDYTNRDYSSLLASMLELAAQKLPEWTDRSPNDFGRVLLELFAYTGDVLLYYQDRIANEAFLSTAVERRSVIDLLALIGYTLATPAPASVDLTITVPDTVQSVQIDAGARFATKVSPGKAAVEFVYLPSNNQSSLFTRPASGKFEFKIPVLHATPVSEELGRSDGKSANQSFWLKQRPVLLSRNPDAQDYLTLRIGEERWQRRGTLLYSLSSDKHFTVQINDNDEAEIIFGDGKYGAIPDSSTAIYANYLIGGGAKGNVAPNTITVVKSGVNPANVSVTNPRAASGGEERESIENARRQAPGVFRSMQRVVTADDYVALAENFPGVAKAIAIAPSWNFVDVYVVAAGNLVLTDDLRARLLQYFETRRMVTTIVNVRSPLFVPINITVNLDVEPTFYRAEVQWRVEEVIRALFQIERLSFGQTFYLSKIYEAVESVAGVNFAEVTQFRRSPNSNEISASRLQGALLRRPIAIPGTGDISAQIILQSQEFPRLESLTINTGGGLQS